MIFERSDSPSSGTNDCIQTITLRNMSDKLLTFKIKTTSPDKFRVKPGCSLLHPGASATVSVYLLKGYFPNKNFFFSSKKFHLFIQLIVLQQIILIKKNF